jgi:hypothetical protein
MWRKLFVGCGRLGESFGDHLVQHWPGGGHGLTLPVRVSSVMRNPLIKSPLIALSHNVA